MKIIRYADPQGKIHHASQLADGSFRMLAGELLGKFSVTERPAEVARLLAPLVPTGIICIGLNYRRHAEETNAKIPEFPIVFMKSIGAVQNPQEPIELPRRLRSNEVDYEGELAVVIGR